MKTIQEVMHAFEIAALNAGLARNTRKSYASTILEFATMIKRGEITGPQGYFEHLASVKKLSPNTVCYALNAGKKSVASPLDTASRDNLIPIRKSA